MGRASKWIINFLLGKKEDKKQTDRYITSGSGIPPAAPKVARRWSFGRSSGKGMCHRISKSVGSIDTLQLAIPSSGVGPVFQHITLLQSVAMIPVDVENAAATKIQAIFRAYLARRALWALRGLVKLQALVRGYLVRKQATATMRCMRALMSIQVRARARRVQMAEEITEVVLSRRRSVHRKFPQEVMHNGGEIYRVSKSKSGYFDYPRFERTERGNLTSSDREQQLEDYYVLSSAQNTPRIQSSPISKAKSATASFGFKQMDCINDFVPHYMVNTESSKAKARSQSEPRQRPQWRVPKKSKKRASIDGSSPLLVETRRGNSRVKGSDLENQESWFVKLYRSRTLFKDTESSSTSTAASKSNFTTSLLAYEPHLTMY